MSTSEFRCEAATSTAVQEALRSSQRHPVLYYRCCNAAPFTRAQGSGSRYVCEPHRRADRITWWDEVPATIRAPVPCCEAIVAGERCSRSAVDVLADGGPPQLICAEHPTRVEAYAANSPDLNYVPGDLLAKLSRAEDIYYSNLEWIVANRLRAFMEMQSTSAQRRRSLHNAMRERGPLGHRTYSRDYFRADVLERHPEAGYESFLSHLLPREIPNPQTLRALAFAASELPGVDGEMVVLCAAERLIRCTTEWDVVEPVREWLLDSVETLARELTEASTETSN